MLIAEDLLLLLTDDETGRLTVRADEVDVALGGAVLLELALQERIGLTGQGGSGKSGRVVVHDGPPTGDAVLDAGLALLTQRQGRKPSEAIRPLAKNLRQTCYARLAAAGVVRSEDGRILGIFPTQRWPAQDREHEAGVRRQIGEALLEQLRPQPRVAGLIALLHALRAEGLGVDARAHALPMRELRRRADRIARDDWASAAVRAVLDEMTAAIAASVAITAATT
jgi:hypothetical protein